MALKKGNGNEHAPHICDGGLAPLPYTYAYTPVMGEWPTHYTYMYGGLATLPYIYAYTPMMGEWPTLHTYVWRVGHSPKYIRIHTRTRTHTHTHTHKCTRAHIYMLPIIRLLLREIWPLSKVPATTVPTPATWKVSSICSSAGASKSAPFHVYIRIFLYNASEHICLFLYVEKKYVYICVWCIFEEFVYGVFLRKVSSICNSAGASEFTPFHIYIRTILKMCKNIIFFLCIP